MPAVGDTLDSFESTWELHFRRALWALPPGEKFVENLSLAVIGSKMTFLFSKLDQSCIRKVVDEAPCRRQGGVRVLGCVPPGHRRPDGAQVDVVPGRGYGDTLIEPAVKTRSERLPRRNGELCLPSRLGHDGAIRVWRTVHDLAEGRIGICEYGGPDRLHETVQSLYVALAHQVMRLSVQPDHVRDLIFRRRRGTDEHRHGTHTTGMPGGEGQLMRRGSTGAYDVNGSKVQLVQDCGYVVGRLTEPPPGQSARGTETWALGRDDPQVPLRPRGSVRPQGVTTPRCSGNSQEGHTVHVPELGPGDNSPVGTLQPQITDTFQNRSAHNRRVLQTGGLTIGIADPIVRTVLLASQEKA